MGILYIFVMIFQVCLYVFVWGIIITVLVNSFRRSFNHRYFKQNIVVNKSLSQKKTYQDVTKAKLEMFHINDIESLKDYLFNLFLKFEKAYNNLDYNTMKITSTKQLYHNYYTGISLDLKIGKKRIIENIEKKKVIIYEIDSTSLKQTAGVMIEVSYINYMIDKDGIVISGKRETPIVEKFEVTFRKDFEREDISKCPNCGASVIGNDCEFCRTPIKNVDFKISSIKRIIEKK